MIEILMLTKDIETRENILIFFKTYFKEVSLLKKVLKPLSASFEEIAVDYKYIISQDADI